MNNPLAASKNIMKNYLSELMTDDNVTTVEAAVDQIDEISLENKRLDKLLQNVSKTKDSLPSTHQSTNYKVVTQQVTSTIKNDIESPLLTNKSKGAVELIKKKDYRSGGFQVMYFDVAGLIIAVPLIELGGIHNTDKTNALIGKPDWFKGVMIHRGNKINVVDTALWVMPEKCNDTLINSLNYQYVIMLGDSQWGLLAERLVDTVTLEQNEVKWLDKPSKRPWLAGLVKERMCALLDIEALIKLLDDGAGII